METACKRPDLVLFPQDVQVICACNCPLSKKDRFTLTCFTEGCQHFGEEFKVPTMGLERTNPAPATTVPAAPLENRPPLAYLRQTGRTTRMLHKAAELVATGTPVTIIAADHHTWLHICLRIQQELPPCCQKTIQVRTAAELRLSGLLNLTTLWIPGVIGAVLFDHYALEAQAAVLLKELHAYDPPNITVSPDWRKEVKS